MRTKFFEKMVFFFSLLLFFLNQLVSYLVDTKGRHEIREFGLTSRGYTIHNPCAPTINSNRQI